MTWVIVLVALNVLIPIVFLLYSLPYQRREDFWDAEVRSMEDQLREEGSLLSGSRR